ncbi:prolyl oligopeptidase family serine peptidase [Listeria welshimeri]|uniref:prolyl oligopeptidase family serine peptidase n=1 Tax=Listeria welshimeri TaxID=1643 RepID=UPI0010B3E8AB|nr:prolyl oligopeptidase family serine peptidase [Listeria welshimeri]MBC1613399.1 prolyl oligopeptidase family serine peptidase [Listeria welshimeri]MBC1622514.1 prolyl oligopeptidase family serine peptidase [Listeria welshimeri]MBC1629910.1 prolyl oligopeptidase family serine peptidase [Listeria welshimeri]MBC1678580.1 prolyl oligopeptidase family serine peptidase [Listeria welshimeri]MBC1680698.1 prolyl oligopeptidase family serine peptidase [Listeria welshimeri]
MKKKLSFSLLLMILAVFAVGCSNSDSGEKITSKNTTLVTQVIDKGEVGSAIIIDYKGAVTGKELSNADFSVFAGDKSRGIKAVYTSKEATVGTPAAKGNYVVVELNPTDDNASTLNFNIEKFINERANVKYTVKQNSDIKVGDKDFNKTTALKVENVVSPTLDTFKANEFVDGSTKMPYRMYSPKASKDKKPLIIYLHGSGERGNDNELQLLGTDGPATFAAATFQSTTPSYVLAPQVEWDEARNGWFTEGKTQTVKKLIDQVIKENKDIDSSRIYLTGVSNGATGAWKILTENPDFFAAAAPIAGYMYDKDAEFTVTGTSRYLKAKPADAAKIKNVPIWAYQAEDDQVNSVEGTKSAVKAIQDAGGTKVQMTIYPAGLVAPSPHASWEKAYNDTRLLTWMTAQVK